MGNEGDVVWKWGRGCMVKREWGRKCMGNNGLWGR